MVEESLGFVPARPVVLPEPPATDVRRAVFRARKILVGLVYDAAHLEGSPYRFPEVQTLLDGVTVGGHRLEDQRLILNLRAAWDALLGAVLAGQFALSQDRYCALHRLVAAEEALARGTFRTGSVEVAGTRRTQPLQQRHWVSGSPTACRRCKNLRIPYTERSTSSCLERITTSFGRGTGALPAS